MNTSKYDDVSGAFSIDEVKKRIAHEAELIGNYVVEDSVKLKDFMGYFHKAMTLDSRVVTLLSPEELNTYFRGLEILSNHAMEDTAITTPANNTAAGKKKLIEETTDQVLKGVDLGAMLRGES